MLKIGLIIILGYLLGSISFGIIVARIKKKIDIRDFGSGNTGFTNVGRIVGKKAAVLVLLGDVLKGSLAVALGYYGGGASYGLATLGGLMAMCGHTYPLYFGFKGGKGVATGLGVLLALAPDVTLFAVLVFLLTVFSSRYVSLGSLLAALSVPIFLYLFKKPEPVFLFGVLSAIFIIYNHRTNLVRLYQGTENKVGQKRVGKNLD